MDATNPMTPENQQKRADNKRKRKAILAGGVVLGLGAAVTLAAWSDDVFGTGTFGTGGTFAIEASPDALPTTTGFTDASTAATAATLTFAATNMTPGDTSYAPISIRTKQNTTLPGVLNQVSAVTDAGLLSPYLSYAITSGATSCTTASHDGTSWAAGTVSATSSNATLTGTNPALAAATPSAAGVVAPLCIAVTLADTQAAKDAINGATGTTNTIITWDFRAVQNP